MKTYCLKCKEHVTPKNAKKIELSNGRPAMEGKCPECGGKVFKILPSSDKAKAAAKVKRNSSDGHDPFEEYVVRCEEDPRRKKNALSDSERLDPRIMKGSTKDLIIRAYASGFMDGRVLTDYGISVSNEVIAELSTDYLTNPNDPQSERLRRVMPKKQRIK